MRKRSGLASTLVAGIATMTLLAGQAHAAVIWDGDAALGTGVFLHIGSNCSPGTVTPSSDPVQGAVWRYHKPAGSPRCETKGLAHDHVDYTFANNSTHYFGWKSKLDNLVDNHATFQWKSYAPGHTQNWPVVLKMINGELTMIQRQPGNVVHTVWSHPVTVNNWNSIVLGLHLSDREKGGWVELWFDGKRQTFSDGSARWAARTFDGDGMQPKWGVYGAQPHEVNHYVDGLKMGDSYADVAP